MSKHLQLSAEATQANAEFLTARERLVQAVRVQGVEQGHGASMALDLTRATDAWIMSLWTAACEGIPARLFALGGYGRSELSFASDVDLVIEVSPQTVATSECLLAVERFMAWCRETRVKVSHSVRTPEQTQTSFAEDFRTAVSYLDIRGLNDDAEGLRREAVEFLRGDDHGVGFVRNLFEGYRQRHGRFGQTIYRLEPELKNGPGGLRDLHAIRWAGLVTQGRDVGFEDALGFGAEQRHTYAIGQAWILGLRLFMHASHGRKHDRMNFADQESMARMNLAAGEGMAALHDATEALMRHHYRVAKDNTRLAERLLRLWGASRLPERREKKEGFWVGGDLIGSDAALTADSIVAILEHASKHPDLYLEPSLESRMEEAICDLDPADFTYGPSLCALLTDPNASPLTSSRVLDLGLMVKAMPEFEPLVCHVHHDVYHVYTTDVHSVKCMEAGRALILGGPTSLAARWPYLAEVVEGIEDPDTFIFSCLVHDIGKNRGGDHSRKGAAMMASIGPRMGFDAHQTERLTFLVREHLSMARIARRRDLGDLRVIRDLASKVRTTGTLRMLTLLTFCDMATVGDDVLNDWNASLLFSLYRRVKALLAHGAESMWQEAEGVVAQRKAELIAACHDDRGVGALGSAVDGFFRDIPVGHIMDTPVDGLIRQFEVYRRVGRQDAPVIEFVPDEQLGTTEVIVAARDVPGALAAITGTLSAAGLNILSAQILSTGSGRTLDIFRVARSGGAGHAASTASQAALVDPRRIAQVTGRLEGVLTGKLAVEDLLVQRINEQKLPERALPSVETMVSVVPDASEQFTVIEIRAPDRIGLLYQISSTLGRHGVNIHLSKVDSVGTQVIDTFYVEKPTGGPLDPEALPPLLQALEDVVRSPIGP